MTCQLAALTIDANDPPRLARFWGAFLGREVTTDPRGGLTLGPGSDTEFDIRFMPTGVPKTVPDQMHFDLTSASLDDQEQTVARALNLGARHIDVGQRPEEGHVVLADPEGNEFCVIEPGNKFLAGCGVIGCMAGDGSQQAGYFWSEALGWPLVWDRDQETAIQSPRGGSKLSWGGPPLPPKPGKYRLHFDLAVTPGGDLRAEAGRLMSLGAARADIGQGEVSWVVLADPDGHEFCLLPPLG